MDLFSVSARRFRSEKGGRSPMMNAGNLPGISRIFRLLLHFTVIYSMLAWCSDIAASDNARRPYVPPSEVPAILQSTPEEVAQGWDGPLPLSCRKLVTGPTGPASGEYLPEEPPEMSKGRNRAVKQGRREKQRIGESGRDISAQRTQPPRLRLQSRGERFETENLQRGGKMA